MVVGSQFTDLYLVNTQNADSKYIFWMYRIDDVFLFNREPVIYVSYSSLRRTEDKDLILNKTTPYTNADQIDYLFCM